MRRSAAWQNILPGPGLSRKCGSRGTVGKGGGQGHIECIPEPGEVPRALLGIESTVIRTWKLNSCTPTEVSGSYGCANEETCASC